MQSSSQIITTSKPTPSVIFVLAYFLVLVLVAVFEIFFSFSFVLVFIIFLVLVFQLFLSFSLVSVLHYFSFQFSFSILSCWSNTFTVHSMTHHYHNHCHSMSSSPATLSLSVSHNSHQLSTVYRLITVLFSSVQLNQFRRISSSIAGKHAVPALWSSCCACPPSDFSFSCRFFRFSFQSFSIFSF